MACQIVAHLWCHNTMTSKSPHGEPYCPEFGKRSIPPAATMLREVVQSIYISGSGGGVQLRTLPLVPSPTGPHPARGDSGVCMCIHVCLVWSIFPTAFIVLQHLQVCRQLHTDSPAQFDSIWTWSNAHMRSESSSPTGDRTRVARLAVQCSTNLATPSSIYISNLYMAFYPFAS